MEERSCQWCRGVWMMGFLSLLFLSPLPKPPSLLLSLANCNVNILLLSLSLDLLPFLWSLHLFSSLQRTNNSTYTMTMLLADAPRWLLSLWLYIIPYLLQQLAGLITCLVGCFSLVVVFQGAPAFTTEGSVILRAAAQVAFGVRRGSEKQTILSFSRENFEGSKLNDVGYV